MPRVSTQKEAKSAAGPLAGKSKEECQLDVSSVSGGGHAVDLERLAASWAKAQRGEAYTYSNEDCEKKSRKEKGTGKTEKKLSSFRIKVLAQCAAVPRGRITTYAAIAKTIGCASCQAVGQALKMNPFSPVVPCHRVVKADLSIGGFHGAKDPASPEIRRKVAKLHAEGVDFVMDKTGKYVLVDKKCVI